MAQPTQTPIPNSQTSIPPLWTVEEVSAHLQLRPETVRNMARTGKIPCVKVGKRVWRFYPEQIKAWLTPAHV